MTYLTAFGLALALPSALGAAQSTPASDSGGSNSVTAATLFQAASNSKPVSGTATLGLVADRKLDLDADVNRYLKSTLRRDFIASADPATAASVLEQIPGWIAHYNAVAPLSALGYQSPQQYRSSRPTAGVTCYHTVSRIGVHSKGQDSVIDAYRMRATPTLYLLDSSHVLRDGWVGVFPDSLTHRIANAIRSLHRQP